MEKAILINIFTFFSCLHGGVDCSATILHVFDVFYLCRWRNVAAAMKTGFVATCNFFSLVEFFSGFVIFYCYVFDIIASLFWFSFDCFGSSCIESFLLFVFMVIGILLILVLDMIYIE